MGSQMMRGGRVAMEFAGGNLFVLQDGKLTKYDGKTLKDEGSVQVVDAAKLQPAAANRRGAARDGAQDNQLPPPPQPPLAMGQASLLLDGGNALIVTGDEFIRVDTDTMKFATRSTLPSVQDNQGQGGMPFPHALPAELKLNKDTLYILRGNLLCSVNIADGKVIAKVRTAAQLPQGPGAGMPPGPPPEGGQRGNGFPPQ
jgi:hypothetical protein